MVILFSGKQGSGKSTTVEGLQSQLEANGIKVKRFKFAQALYEMHDAVLAVLTEYGIKRDIAKDGPLLQLLGTEWGRNTINKDIWVNCAQNWHKKQLLRETSTTVYIFDDCRFKNELDAFPDSLKIRLEAPSHVRKDRCSAWRDNEKHQSEIDLDDYMHKFDLVVDTDWRTHTQTLDVIRPRVYSELEKRKVIDLSKW